MNRRVPNGTHGGVRGREITQISLLLDLDILPNGQWMGPYNTSDMRDIFNDMFIELCQSDNPDVETALADASKEISEKCQLSYSIK